MSATNITPQQLRALVLAGEIELFFKAPKAAKGESKVSGDPKIYVNRVGYQSKIRIQLGTDEQPAVCPFGVSALYKDGPKIGSSQRREVALNIDEDTIDCFKVFDSFVQDQLAAHFEEWNSAQSVKDLKEVAGNDPVVLQRAFRKAYKPLVVMPKEEDSEYAPTLSTKITISREAHENEYVAKGGSLAKLREERAERTSKNKKSDGAPGGDADFVQQETPIAIWRRKFVINKDGTTKRGPDGHPVKRATRGTFAHIKRNDSIIPIVDLDPLSLSPKGKWGCALVMDSAIVIPREKAPSEQYIMKGGIEIAEGGDDSDDEHQQHQQPEEPRTPSAGNGGKRKFEDSQAQAETPADTSASKRVKTEETTTPETNIALAAESAAGDRTPPTPAVPTSEGSVVNRAPPLDLSQMEVYDE